MQDGHDIVYGSGEGGIEFKQFYKQTLGIDNDCEQSDILSSEFKDFPRSLHNNLDSFQYFTVDKFNKSFNTNIKGQLSTININVRGLECNFSNLTQFLNTMHYKFDVIFLTECHIQADDLNIDIHNRHPIDGYDKFYVKSCIKFGGVVMYIKQKFKAQYYLNLTKTCTTHDSLYVKIDPINLHGNKKRKNILFLGGYYRHCRESDKIQFIDSFSSDISQKALQKNDIIIGGDFNICLMKSTSNADSLCFLNSIIGNTCEILIFKPTRIQYYKNSLQIKSATLIDQIITNLFEYECTAGNLLYSDSDHHATFAIFNNYTDSVREDLDIYRRQISKINEEALLDDFNSLNWNELVYYESNLDVATENLNKSIVELCDKHAPLKKLSNRRKKHNNKPWIDDNLLTLIRMKNHAHAVKSSTPTAINTEAFNKLRNLVTSQTRDKRKKFFAEYFQKFRTNSRKLWDGINQALEQTRYKKSLPNKIKDVNGKPVEGDQNIANAFAKYFKDIPGKTKQKIGPFKHPYLHYLNKQKPIDDYLELSDTNFDEIHEQVIKLKDNSSSGPVQVPNTFLKIIARPLSQVLTTIINRSIFSGYVPSVMKIGKQTPVHKGGDISIRNYRPITVCSSISKILEKIVRDRVLKYINRVKILNKCQFGFRNKHSTNHAIMNLTELTLEGLENGLKVGGVFLDIAKAFDTVNHRYLLRKLEYYGFRGRTLMWMESYLTNRQQYVNIRGHNSEMYKVECGIPQGAVLAPILFILFMNDITLCSNIFNFSMYADDTCLILGIKVSEYDNVMKSELPKVVDWFSSNELLLNSDKTDYLNFGPHYNKIYIKGEYDLTELHSALPQFLFDDYFQELGDPDHIELNKKGEFILHELTKVCPKYFMNELIEMPDGNIISEPEHVKYLGVYFDNNLKFKRHIDITCCKINRMVGILWKSEHLNLEAKKMIYHSLIESHLNYAITIWGSHFARNIAGIFEIDHIPENLKHLCNVQNKIIRAIFRKPKFDKISQTYTRNTPLYRELEVLRLYDLYYFNLACIAHEYFHVGDLPEAVAENFVKKSHICSLNTRNNAIDLHYKTPKLVSSYKKPSIAATMIWNTLPVEIRIIPGKTKFKTKLKEYYIEKYE